MPQITHLSALHTATSRSRAGPLRSQSSFTRHSPLAKSPDPDADPEQPRRSSSEARRRGATHQHINTPPAIKQIFRRTGTWYILRLTFGIPHFTHFAHLHTFSTFLRRQIISLTADSTIDPPHGRHSPSEILTYKVTSPSPSPSASPQVPTPHDRTRCHGVIRSLSGAIDTYRSGGLADCARLCLRTL